MRFDPSLAENKMLFDRAKSGSQAFTQELLKQQTSDMYYLARAYLKESEEAKDAVRLGFQKAFKRFDTCPSIDGFTKWLSDIIRLSAISLVVPVSVEECENRYTRVDERPASDVSFPDIDVSRKQFLQILNVLTDAERAAVAARFYEHMEVEQVAELLRISSREAEGLLVNAKKKLNAHKIDIAEFTALANYINPDMSLLAETEVVAPSVQEEVRQEASSVEATKEMPRVEEVKEEKVEETTKKSRKDKHKKEVEDDVDYEDDEGYDDYDYDKHGNRIGHKSHWFLKLLLFIVILATLTGGLLAAVYKLDEDMFYAIPGTTKLVTIIEKVTGKNIPGPYDNVATVAPLSTANTTTSTTTPTPTTGLIAGSETGTDTIVGKAEITLTSINIRSDHSTSGQALGAVYQGETYDVYGVYKADDFTWYRIGEGQWIASDGSYLNYTAN